MRRVVVVGSGLAGTAAAHAARRAGAEVTVVLGPPGASALGSGALDDRWCSNDSEAPTEPTDEERAFLEALALYRVSPKRALVATESGRLRFARGRDGAILDLAALEVATVLLPRVERADWDADALARALSSDPLAVARGLRFEPVDVPVLRHTDELRMPAYDLAARHDDEGRVAWLADRLRDVTGSAAAMLLGPFLGLDASASAKLTEALGVPVGETLSPIGGLAGMRFERARDRLLASLGVLRQAGRASRVHRDGARPLVELEGGSALEADGVILALGGVAGGGIELSATSFGGLPSSASGRGPFFLASLESPAWLASRGRPLDAPSSPFGPEVERLAWSQVRGRSELETVGMWADGAGRARRRDGEVVPWLFVAGDVIFDGPRTVLAAIQTGLAAGADAARG